MRVAGDVGSLFLSLVKKNSEPKTLAQGVHLAGKVKVHSKGRVKWAVQCTALAF